MELGNRKLGALLLLAWFHSCWLLLRARPIQSQGADASICQSMVPSPTLEMFVDKLPKLKKISVADGEQLTLGAYKIQQVMSMSDPRLHRDLPPTTLYAYGTTADSATYPGPTLEAIRNVPAHIRWENHIHDATHMFTIDPTVMWANPTAGVPIVTHLHGAQVASVSDGHPEAWFTASGERGAQHTTQNYTYPNSQPPAMLWYHDHAIGITRLNVLAGLTGLYIIRPAERQAPAWMPPKKFEVTLVLQDKALFANGSVNFPTVGLALHDHPHWCPEYFGDTILVNGKAWPYLVVKPRKHRFRLVNAGNARVYELSLSSPDAWFVQIGSDGGLLERPQRLRILTVAPAERVDFVIDFAGVAGQNVTLRNAALVPYPDGDPAFTPEPTRSVMLFKVKRFDPDDATDAASIPDVLRDPDAPVSVAGAFWRTHTLIEASDANDFPTGSLLSNLSWTDPVTETPYLGATEVWEFINLTPDAHPMHIHLVHFKVLNLQEFNMTLYEGGCDRFESDQVGKPGSCLVADPVAPKAYHAGWKDTVTALPGFVTRLVVQWSAASGAGAGPGGGDGDGGFSFDATAAPGYLWHCHIVDHEDNAMMRPIQLRARPAS